MVMEQRDMIVAEYHPRLLAVEWFVPDSFSEMQLVAKLVRGLRWSL